MFRNFKSTLSPLFVAILIAGLFLLAEDAYARAGGGSSGGGGRRSNGLLDLIIYAGFAAWTGIMAYIVHLKNKKCKVLLEQLSKQDKTWDAIFLKTHIEETYFKVQQAWKARDQEIARQYMSDRLYHKHKLQTDEMIKEGLKPIMNCINLKSASIVEILDFEDDSNDRFCAHIVGSMVDYVIHERTKELVSGNPDNATFKELWKFVRNGNSWVLDEIDQSVSASELLNMIAKSEA